MDETLARWDYQVFLGMEALLGVYRQLGLSREQARKRVELAPSCGPADLGWFDVRWPE
jgi:hypothetical protein